MAIAQSKIDADSRMASYSHDSMAGTGSLWVVDLLRLVRPVLTFSLIVLVGMLYFSADMGGRATIEASVIYMASSAVLWWFGDRALRKKRQEITMTWKTVKSNLKFVINNKPVIAGILLGTGFVVGYYVKLLACS